MIAYAAGDVLYLHALSDLLKAELIDAGRDQWVREECRLLTGVRPAEMNHNPLFWRFSGAGRLDRRSLAVLEAVLKVRNQIAQKKDRPVFKIMSSRAVLRLAVEKPVTLSELKESGVLSEKQIAMYAGDLLAAVNKAMDLSLEDLPIYPRKKKPPSDPQIAHRIKALRTRREAIAHSLKMPAGQLINNSQLSVLATVNPENIEALSHINGIKAWQIDAFGGELISALNPGKKKDKG
jgi:ribonuclease D